MKLSKLFAVIFGLLGMALAACAIQVALTYRSADPILISTPKNASQTADAMLREACSGDYAAASQRILGTPKFGMTYTPQGIPEQMIWEEFLGSFSYELVGECFVTEDGFAQNARISYLDLDSVTADLQARVQALLEQRVEEAQRPEEIYDENHELKESFVMEALQDAVAEAIAQNARITTVDVTVSMIWRNEQWCIVPNDGLLSALTGGIA